LLLDPRRAFSSAGTKKAQKRLPPGRSSPPENETPRSWRETRALLLPLGVFFCLVFCWSIGGRKRSSRSRALRREGKGDSSDENSIFSSSSNFLLLEKKQNSTPFSPQETTAFAARWDFDITSGSPLAGGRWEWLTTARKNAEEAAAAEGKEQEEKAASDIAFRPKASSSPSRHHLPSAACCASDVTSFPMTTSPPESDRESASPAPSCGGNNEGAPAAAGWPVA